MTIISENSNELTVEINQNTVEISNESSELTVNVLTPDLNITVDVATLSVIDIVHSLAIVSPSTIINQYFNGVGVVSDESTIEGNGTELYPLKVNQELATRALNSFQVATLFSEISTQLERESAQQNLGLHIIDGGTFEY